MKKVTDLFGAELDYWVAKAGTLSPRIGPNGGCYTFDGKYSPSTDWSQGGPILEREKIELVHCKPSGVFAIHPIVQGAWWGAKVLVAGMHCFVASVYGIYIDEEEI